MPLGHCNAAMPQCRDAAMPQCRNAALPQSRQCASHYPQRNQGYKEQVDQT